MAHLTPPFSSTPLPPFLSLATQWSADSSTVISGLFSSSSTCSGSTDDTFTAVPANGTCTVGIWSGAESGSVKVYKAPAYTPPTAPTATSGASEAATAAAAIVGAAAAIAMAARV
jgi:hypothetical protein